jgi:hypothetical protein
MYCIACSIRAITSLPANILKIPVQDTDKIQKTTPIAKNTTLPSITAEQILAAEAQRAPCLDEAPVVGVFMVKDEAHVIEKTLEPYVNGGIKHFYIFDTGSTDKTVETVKNYFNRKSIIHGYIGQEPFINFAASRNRGLDLAHERFPNAYFLLMPDAEWYLEGVERLIEFCKEVAHDTAHSYLVRIGNQYINFYTSRLIRNDGYARFTGVVHEDLNAQLEENKAPYEVYFRWDPSSRGIEKTERRWQQDKKLLLKEFKENPSDSRTVFYLAQTYDCLHEEEAALQYYRLRATMPGGIEESYMALFRMGQMYERLMEKEPTRYTWAQAMDFYLRAHQFRPERAEPIIYIAAHYAQEKKWTLAYRFAQWACQIPYPEQDTLFVEDYGYNIERYNVLAGSAWYLKECEAGLKAAEMLEKNKAKVPNLKQNIQAFRNCVAQKARQESVNQNMNLKIITLK